MKQLFVYLPNKYLLIKTVNNGALLLIVSVKLTATKFKETNPNTTVINLVQPTKIMCL